MFQLKMSNTTWRREDNTQGVAQERSEKVTLISQPLPLVQISIACGSGNGYDKL